MLTEYNGFKLGDRVYWPGGEYAGEDRGTIVCYFNEIFSTNDCNETFVWVEWDSNKRVQKISVDKIQREYQNNLLTNEQEAVMLLLSLGYTVSKNQK